MKFSVGDRVRILPRAYALVRGDARATGKFPTDDEIKALVCSVQTVVGYASAYHVSSPYGVDMGHDQPTHYLYESEIELIAPEPRFKVGDRVKVVQARKSWKKRFIGKTLTIDGIDNDNVWGDEKPYVVHGDNEGDSTYVWFDDELAPAPYTPRHVFAASQASHIDDETIDRWVDEGVKNVEAQKTLSYDNPSFTTKSGDALVVVENGKAYLYRLEGTTNV